VTENENPILIFDDLANNEGRSHGNKSAENVEKMGESPEIFLETKS